MNVNTGELLLLHELDEIPEGFISVPDMLNEEATKKLNGEDHTVVDLASDSPLAHWARKQRHRCKKRTTNKRKMAKASRRKNRS